jgi:hypothetical protein
VIAGMNTTEGGSVVIGGHRAYVLEPRHELASHADVAANDDHVDRALGMFARAAGAIALVCFAAAGWAAMGAPGLSALGLLV